MSELNEDATSPYTRVATDVGEMMGGFVIAEPQPLTLFEFSVAMGSGEWATARLYIDEGRWAFEGTLPPEGAAKAFFDGVLAHLVVPSN